MHFVALKMNFEARPAWGIGVSGSAGFWTGTGLRNLAPVMKHYWAALAAVFMIFHDFPA